MHRRHVRFSVLWVRLTRPRSLTGGAAVCAGGVAKARSGANCASSAMSEPSSSVELSCQLASSSAVSSALGLLLLRLKSVALLLELARLLGAAIVALGVAIHAWLGSVTEGGSLGLCVRLAQLRWRGGGGITCQL